MRHWHRISPLLIAVLLFAQFETMSSASAQSNAELNVRAAMQSGSFGD
jgi:hypothetical protein